MPDIAIGAAFVVVICVCYSIIRSQQRTIDMLTNKIMARDYKEYASMVATPKEAPERKLREPLSWHDDPNVESEH